MLRAASSGAWKSRVRWPAGLAAANACGRSEPITTGTSSRLAASRKAWARYVVVVISNSRRCMCPFPCSPPPYLSPGEGIGARLSAKQNWERGCIPSPLVGEGEDEGERQAHPPPVSSPARGEEAGNDVPHTLPILIPAPMPSPGEGRRLRPS